jgi:hypothetical protein
MRIGEEMINATQEWQTPKLLRDVQSFLGYGNFSRHFILGFSKICHPLTESMHRDKKDCEWTLDMEITFVDLKDRFIKSSILTHYSPEFQCIITTDTSYFAVAAIISHNHSHDKLHPIACHTFELSSSKKNDEIDKTNILAVVDFFEIWRTYREGTLFMVLVFTEYQNLEFFTTRIVLNR